MNQKSKICHVSSVHLSFDTRIFYRYCKSLTANYDVTLIACHPKDETINGIKIKAYPRYKNRFFRVFFSWLIMIPKCLRVNAVLYHLHDPELIPLGLVLKFLGKKVIYDIHENIAEDIFDKDWIRNKNFWYGVYNLFEKPALRYFKIILAEDSYLKRYQKRTKNVDVIHNFCDISFFEQYRIDNKRNPYNLFYIGVLFENRGVLEICKAIYIQKQKGNHFVFHCVGELYTPLADKITNLPFYEEIREQIIFYGRKNLEDGYNISKQCGIGLCIIHPMSNSIESYPTKLFEYMTIGLPIVTSNFPLYKSVVENVGCGNTVDPQNADELADAIIKIATDTKLYNNMVENGLPNVKKMYNWETEKQKLLAIYMQLLGNN